MDLFIQEKNQFSSFSVLKGFLLRIVSSLFGQMR